MYVTVGGCAFFVSFQSTQPQVGRIRLADRWARQSAFRSLDTPEEETPSRTAPRT